MHQITLLDCRKQCGIWVVPTFRMAPPAQALTNTAVAGRVLTSATITVTLDALRGIRRRRLEAIRMDIEDDVVWTLLISADSWNAIE